MPRPRMEDTIDRPINVSFDELLESIIREQRPSPEALAFQFGCSVKTLMDRLRDKPVKIRSFRCLEWID